MFNYIKQLSATFSLLLILFSSASTDASILSNGINTLIKNTKNKAHIGIFIQSMKTGKIVYSINKDALFTPASVQKLITTTGALIYLKPQFRFSTNLYQKGTIKNHQLNGSISIKFSGDPSFSSKDLHTIIQALKSNGVHSIHGNVNIDTSSYNQIPYPPGWLWDDLSYDFSAPLNTVIIDENKFLLHINPNSNKPKLRTYLPANTIHLINHFQTVNRHKKNCPITIYSDKDNYYLLKGCVIKTKETQYRSLAMRNPLKILIAKLKNTLAKQKIIVTGHIQEAPVPSNSILIKRHQSAPLSKLIIHLLKSSDNLYANTLLKKLGQTYYHQQGTWQNGLQALKQIINEQIGIQVKSIRINDGAGLSRYNLLSPYSLGQILYYVDHHKIIRKAIRNALPIAGTDGTLIDRMKSFARHQQIHAKTGSMTSVTSLAGFSDSKSQGRFAFVIMINGFVGKNKSFIQLENKISEFLAAQ